MAEAHTLARDSATADIEASKYDEEKPHDLEASKGGVEKPHDVMEETLDVVSEVEKRDLQRGLSQRHLSMIALAGSIGTGLFLSLGGAIATAGPVGSLLAYLGIGLIVCAVQYALGETTAFLPVTGSFTRHAEILFDESLGFSVGWNIVYGNALSIPSEISAICVLFTFWTDVNPTAWIMTFITLKAIVGYSKIRWFGEAEFVFALIKIVTIIGLFFFGLITDLGGVSGVERVGFRYWRDPGPFVESIGTGNFSMFLGFWSILISAVFSFAGVESVAMAAAETRNPRQSIPTAVKRVFWRVTIFYLAMVWIVGLLIPSTDERLGSYSGTASTSPFVLVASAAGIRAIPSIINAVLITSAFSSGNQALLAGTRVLYGLAVKRQAPSVFLRTTRWGTPYVCVTLFIAAAFLAFMSLSNGALTIFYWFVSLVGAGVLVSWSVILFNHLRLLAAFRKQGISTKELPWHHSWTPYTSAIALGACLLILLTNGFQVFIKGGWSASGFITAYLDIPLVLAAYAIWKVVKRTSIVKLEDIPLREMLAHITAHPEEPAVKAKGPIRFISWLWD